ncbi:unnamed protein product, partial [Sphacelaria rigidula]
MVNVKKNTCGYEGCSTKPSYGVSGSTKAEFCSKHAGAGMVNVKKNTCGYEGCSTKPSYGVAGSTKAEFCSKHAWTGMVNVKYKKCGSKGCSSQPSHGIAGSTKATFCSEHAWTGMVNVKYKKCGYEGCSLQPPYGVAGSTKATFCSKHAGAGMVNVKDKKCGCEGCSKQASYGVAGSMKAELCFEHARGCSTQASYGVTGSTETELCPKHARTGMVNEGGKMCPYEGCLTSSCSEVTGREKAELSSKHASAGMVDVKKCGYEGCPVCPSCGVAGRRRADFCSKHTKAGMVRRVPKRCKEEGCFKSTPDEKHNVDEATRQLVDARTTAAVLDTTELNTGEGFRDRSPTKGSAANVANVRGAKRKRAALSGPVVNDDVGAPRSVCVRPGQGVRTPLLPGNSPLLLGYPPSRAYGKESLGARAEAGLKVEMTGLSPTHDGDGVRKCREQAVRSIGRTSERGCGGFTSSGGGSTGLLWGSLQVIPGHQ